MTTAQDGGKVVSLTHRLPLPPGNAPGTHTEVLNMGKITCVYTVHTLHVSDRFTVHHQESSTVYTALGIFHTEVLKMGKIASVYAVLDS